MLLRVSAAFQLMLSRLCAAIWLVLLKVKTASRLMLLSGLPVYRVKVDLVLKPKANQDGIKSRS